MKSVSPQQCPVAIIGIGCVFAKSPSLKAFLRLVVHGVDAISEPPETHQHLCDYLDPDPKRPDHIYCNRGGFLPQVDFDPSMFGIPPSSLEATDTSQLLGLIVAQQALKDAGYGDGRRFDRTRASVILGVTGTQELVIPLASRLGHPIWRRALKDSGIPDETAETVVRRIGAGYVDWQENSFPGLLGNVVAGRIANRLDLGGTNCVVDAACASSMAAIHLGLLELVAGRSDLVITGGVDTINDPFMHMCFAKTQILSPSGRIRPFSKEADGTLLGEGVGMVVLKRLADAQQDEDHIYAVIRGIGTASDGKSQSIYAPRAEGQAAALRMAYEDADVSIDSVGMVEAHGTGTRVGDQVEFKALCEVFGSPPGRRQRCALGSVKSNIGHTKAAAGTAGLIKTALALYHKVLPPTLNARPVDPDLHVDNSPFCINHALRPWVAVDGDVKRRAGVSAFGFGGSNFHAVLEEYTPEKQAPMWEGSVQIIAFSGSSRRDTVAKMARWVASVTEQASCDDIARLAAESRARFAPSAPHRLAITLEQADDPFHVHRFCRDALAWLRNDDHAADSEVRPMTGVHMGSGAPAGPVAFLFPGQGSQYVGMGRDLVCCFPGSLKAFQEAESCFSISSQRPLHNVLYPSSPENENRHAEQLKATDVAQPAIGAVSVAMLEAVTYFGVTPSAVCGHSYGELVALYSAGWIDRRTLWELSVSRGRMMADVGAGTRDAGTMLAVAAPLVELSAVISELTDDIVLANRNSPNQGVLSGASPSIAVAAQVCRDKGWRSVPLSVSAAFHSHLVAHAKPRFQEHVHKTRWTPNDIPVMSNTLGTAYPIDADAAQTLLVRQVAEPVDFLSNIENLYALGIRTFVEVGPKAVLSRLVGAILKDRPFASLAVDSSAGRRPGLVDLADLLGRLAVLGHEVRLDLWEETVAEPRPMRMRIPLSGANYRTPAAPAQTAGDGVIRSSDQTPSRVPKAVAAAAATPSTPVFALAPKNPDFDETKIKPLATPQPAAKDNPPRPQRDTMDRSKTDNWAHILGTVQQGLAAMQALQSQTTQAHQKYLETQAEASRTLQQIIRGAQQLTGFPPGSVEMAETDGATDLFSKTITTQPEPSAAPTGTSAQTIAAAASNAGIESASIAAVPPAKPMSSPRIDDDQTPTSAATVAAAPDGTVRDTLRRIVSRLTGYPVDMLGMDMDIEADLGIDSIKRVEILSALEEQMPRLPKVTPDMVGTLKTLGQIHDYLSRGDGPVPDLADAASAGSAAPTMSPDAAATQTGADDIHQTLLAIVSRLTGYPVDMLGMDMDIEADLGIDSIKRVEILSALEEQMPRLPKVTPDMVGTLKTLGQIHDYLTVTPKSDGRSSKSTTVAVTPTVVPDANLPRLEIRLAPLPALAPNSIQIPKRHQVGIVAPANTTWAAALLDRFTEEGVTAVVLNDSQALNDIRSLAGLVLVAPMDPVAAFEWTQAAMAQLQDPKSMQPSFLYTVSFLDGAFGFKGRSLDDPEQGSLAGLVKTAALEWPTVRCRALDIDPHWSATATSAAAAAAEMLWATGPEIEVGLNADGRMGLQLLPVAPKDPATLGLTETDVAVVTGGARGVTATSALALASRTACALALVGRSPVPDTEPDWLAPLTEEAEIKKALLQHDFADRDPSPKALENRYRKWMGNRRITETMEQCRRQGIRARYFALDVRDDEAVRSAMAQVRSELGPIKALIHGAGVLEDRLIKDKSVVQFKAVYDTKVQGLRTLLDATRSDDLRHIVIFSSISARMGNTGQVDYAMANEALNKMALQQRHARPRCRVVSINWGPWDGGMVTPSLKRVFVNKGITLIDAAKGADAMVTEMAQPVEGPVEVIYGGPLPREERPERNQGTNAEPQTNAPVIAMTQSAKREIDLARYPVLQSHRLDGRPVVPLALMTEWLAHGALHANPGLTLHGMNHLRLLKGIALDQPKATIRLMAGRPRRKDRLFEVDVEIRNGAQNGDGIIHSSATALLADHWPSPPPFQENGHFKAGSASKRTLEEIYGQILFHGEALRGIERIIRLTENGMTARARSAPSPEHWLVDPLRSRWIGDPLVLDCAFQMAIIWCHEQRQMVSLPSYAAAYRQYRDTFPAKGVTVVMEVVAVTDRKIRSDFTFLDDGKAVVAKLTGYEAIMDPALFKAFGQRQKD